MSLTIGSPRDSPEMIFQDTVYEYSIFKKIIYHLMGLCSNPLEISSYFCPKLACSGRLRTWPLVVVYTAVRWCTVYTVCAQCTLCVCRKYTANERSLVVPDGY